MNKKQKFSFIREINRPCRTAEIATYFEISSYQDRYYLTEFEEQGKIRRTPLRKGASTLWITAIKTENNQ
ncbi:hypothetical protein OM280_18395 [Escherichia albertii]|nr:hypothetical protein [Escherichia albertii]